jgi:hypothetical protein
MAVSNNRHGLRIVQEGDTQSDQIELLVAAPGGRRVKIVEGDVARPRIGMMLHTFFALRLDPRGAHGFSLTLPVRWRGGERGIDGDLGSHEGAEVVVPRGTVAQWMAEAA